MKRLLNQTNASRSTPSRRGIVLLVVLGMLTLFSMLGASYLVFTSRQRSAAFSLNRAETTRVDTSKLVSDALAKILVGTRGPDSSLWGHDLLGDLYGMRDAVEANVMPVSVFPTPTNEVLPAVLLNDQFLRFPTLLPIAATTNTALHPLLNSYPYRRNDAQVERRYPGYTGAVGTLPLNPAFYARPSFPVDDELNGRLLTFDGGPLDSLTFQVTRYFGDHRNATQGRAQLTGQIVIDIRPHLSSSVTVEGESRTLKEWIDDTIFPTAKLFYDYAGLGVVPPATATAYASFYLNGRMLNGPGLGWDRPRRQFHPLGGVNQLMGTDPLRVVAANNPRRPFNLNEVVSTDLNITAIENGTAAGAQGMPVTGIPFQVPSAPLLTTQINWPSLGMQNLPLRNGPDVPVALQGHYAMHRLAPEEIPGTTLESFVQDLPPGDTDEPYDAPDYNNLFLSYFPTDEILGESAPSFVRPAMLNWVVNNREGTTDLLRRQRMLVAIQRSTLRPLPIANDPAVPTVISDRGEGVKALSYANFTGGNPWPGLGGPIDFTSVTDAQLFDLARALAGRDNDADGIIDSWDVDNNGDGEVDSVWIDAGLPLTQSSDGKLIKPLVSYMVEDLGGRVNVNLAGNIAQARNAITGNIQGAVLPNGAVRRPTSSPDNAPGLVYSSPPTSTRETLQSQLPHGWGYGPAEIEIRALFPSVGTLGVSVTEPTPLTSYVADDLMRGPQRLIGERMGVLSSAFGPARAYANMGDTAYGRIVAVPGFLFDPVTGTGDDLRGQLRHPNRPNLHAFTHPQGLPVDAYGRGSIGVGVNGDLVVSGTSHVVTNGGDTAGDALDDPYEMELTPADQPDNPFSFADLEPLLRNNGFDRELLSNRLIEIIEDFHNDASVGQATLDTLRQALADSMTTASNTVATVRGGLPSEFAENTVEATSASSPQRTFHLSLGNGLANEARNAIMWELMPEALRAGRKLNLNRPFGNGFDDDGDGAIDDDQNGRLVGTSVAEVFGENQHLSPSGGAGPYTSTRDKIATGELQVPTVTNHTPSTGNAYSPRNITGREQFARHLYVLAMVLIRDANRDVAFDFPNSYPDLSAFDSPFFGTGVTPDEPRVPSLDTDDPATTTVNERTLDQLSEFNQEYRAWKIAQWAVNVVDFRDTDAIMTRFDYDPNPFDGWNVNVLEPQTYRTVWGTERPELTLEESLAFHDRRVKDTDQDNAGGTMSLQGMDGSATRGDNDMDQYRIPQGSLFLELRSTRSPQPLRTPGSETDPLANSHAYPQELYTFVGGEWQLNLGALAPGNNVPVWRVAISEIHAPGAQPATPASAPVIPDNNTALPTYNPATSPLHEICPDFLIQPAGSDAVATAAALATPIAMDRDTATVQPEDPKFFDRWALGSVIERKRAERAIDRVIFFANNLNPTTIENQLTDVFDEGQIFYNRIASGSYPDNGVYVRGGQNVVIGPRATTYVGSRESSAGGTPTTDPTTGAPSVPYAQFESPQRILLSANEINLYDYANMRQTPTYDVGPTVDATIRPIIGIQAAADPPAAWTTITEPIGVNVSEPLPYQAAPAGRQYYPEPSNALDTSLAGYPVDSYQDYSAGGTRTLPDRPFDDRAAMSELHRAFGATGQRTGTREFFKTAFLQRLADPTQPYHPEFNPYRTVDYITIDLTVFNGSDDNDTSLTQSPADGGGTLWVDDADQDPFNMVPAERFATRYKTGKPVSQVATAGPSTNLMYSANTFPPAPTSAAAAVAANNPYFRIDLNLDAVVSADPTSDAVGTATVHSSTLGYVNHSFGSRVQQGTVAGGTPQFNQVRSEISPYVGMPHAGYPANVMWLNRDYVSAEEMMWVPTSGAGRFNFEFGTCIAPLTTSNQYETSFNQLATPAPMPPAVAPFQVATQDQRFNFNERFKYLWNYFSSSSNVFAYEPAQHELPTGSMAPTSGLTAPNDTFPWLPAAPSDTAPTGSDPRGDDFVGFARNTPAMSDPYPPVPEKTPSPNFWRLLDWVEVPSPYDFDADFVSPELTPSVAGEDPQFGPNIDFRTLGPVPNNPLPTPPFGGRQNSSLVDGDPQNWLNVVPATNLGWNPGSGRWEDNMGTNNAYNGFWTNTITMETFRPPHGFRSRLFRNGQVNLNTVKNLRVYKALMGGFSTSAENSLAGDGAFFAEFLRNRRGYTPVDLADAAYDAQNSNFFQAGMTAGSALVLQTFDHDRNTATAEIPSFDRNIPTQFAGVFKSAMGGTIAPLETMRSRPVLETDRPWSINAAIEREPLEPIQSTILRRDVSRSTAVQADKPVFQREPGNAAVTAPQDHVRSPVHQQLGMTRLSNLATDQSNVFAVWVTVGLFEVDSATLTVGEEVGADTGEFERAKGFFIIDRSVPVEYRPGELTNALETVQFSRILD